MRGWWLPTVLACMAHGAFSVMPVQIGAPQKQEKPDVTFQFSPPPPPPASKPPDIKPPPPQPQRVKKLKKRVLPLPPPPPPETQEELLEEPVEETPEISETPPEVPAVPETVAPVAQKPKPKFDLRAYGKQIHQMVIQHRRYPRAARRLGLEGKVLVKIAILRDGSLAQDPIIYRSSGQKVLDKEAIRMVRAATPLLPLPNEFEKESASLVIPVQFHLRD